MTDLKKEQRLIIAPSGYEPAIARWVWALEDTRRRTKQSLASIKAEAIDWLPVDGKNSIGTILYHLVAIEMAYLYEDILELGWSDDLESLLIYDIREDDGRLTGVQSESLEKHLNRLDAGRTLLLNALGQMSLTDFQRVRRCKDYDITPEWTLHHLMQHEAEHRGQIGELRLRAEVALKL